MLLPFCLTAIKTCFLYIVRQTMTGVVKVYTAQLKFSTDFNMMPQFE